MNKLLLSTKDIINTVPSFDEHLLFALERRYFDFLNIKQLELSGAPCTDEFNDLSDLRMLKIDEIGYENKADIGLHLQNFQNIVAAMQDGQHNVVSMIHGKGHEMGLYYGVAKHYVDGIQNVFSTDNYSDLLERTIRSNFLNARYHTLSGPEIRKEVISPLLEYTEITAFPGIPSTRAESSFYSQGIERFMEGMRGDEYIMLCIAEPIVMPQVDAMIKNLFDLSSSVHSAVKATVQNMRGSSDTINAGMFGMRGIMDSRTEGGTESNAETNTNAVTDSKSMLGTGGTVASGLTLVGGIIGTICAPGVGTVIGTTLGTAAGSLLSGVTGMALSRGVSASNSLSKMHSFSRSIANTAGNTSGRGGFGGYARGWNRSQSVSQEVLNKTAEYCEKVCDTYIQRLQKGKNLGFWNAGVYLFTKDKYTQLKGRGMMRAYLSGEETHWEPIRAISLNEDSIRYLRRFHNPDYNLLRYGSEKKDIEQALSIGMKIKKFAVDSFSGSINSLLERFGHSNREAQYEFLQNIRCVPTESCSKEMINQAWNCVVDANLGHPLGPVLGGVATPMNTEELSIIMNVPRQEVQGISIRESVPFGANYQINDEEDPVTIGLIIHKREPQPDLPYCIPKQLLKKHMFICGTTGSGKTNTCMNIISTLNLPFMVIEPAKTEYRQLLSIMPELKVFTLGSETVSPFRINPFEFVPGSELLTHIDSLKAVFNAAFPMYASMPYILEEAIIGVYLNKGWDLATSTNRYLKNLNDTKFYDYLPTMQDLYDQIEYVVRQKEYAEEQTMNIRAALKARLSSLLTGSKGLMLNTRRSTPLDKLLNEQVVLELKNIGDDDEKCFMMGLLLSSVYEYREIKGEIGSPLKHVLLIEEAHRLLKKVPDYVSPEIGNSRGKAVETFTNVISEIREYGQGLIIVDQIPSRLTPDVIKNTNIKIVHRTLAKDDRDYVGATMNLNEAQENELCLLEVGNAVVYREGMDKSFLVQARLMKENGKMPNITNEILSKKMAAFHNNNKDVFCRYPGFEKLPEIPQEFHQQDFKTFRHDVYKGVHGAFILMLLGETEALADFKKKFAMLLDRYYKISNDEVRQDCYMIYYADKFFAEINRAFSGCYDRTIEMQQIFIDCWFGDYSGLARLRDNSKFMTMRDNYLMLPLWAYLRGYKNDTVLKMRDVTISSSSSVNDIADTIKAMLNEMLLNVPLAPQDYHKVATSLFIQIFEAMPKFTKIFTEFKINLQKE